MCEAPARSPARSPPSARILPGNDLTAWFNLHHLRAAIFREDGQRSRVEAGAVMKEYEAVAGCNRAVDERRLSSASSGGYGKTLQEMGKSHNLELLPQHQTGPGDYDENPIVSNGNPPPWRGNKVQRWAPPSFQSF